MELELFSELYQRIQTDPSILLLGQNYLFAETGQDPVWQYLSSNAFPELNLSRRKADYPTLWAEAVKDSSTAIAVTEHIAQASKLVPADSALKALLKLRWSLLYTSAVAGSKVFSLLTDKGCTQVPAKEKTAKLTYRDKNRMWCVELCGSTEAPPILSNKREQLSFQKQISDRLSWISSTYLEYYGVLVIDGLDPEHDWVSDALFEQLVDLPPNSIYWFSAPDELGEVAKELVQCGTLTVDRDSFCAHILRHMPELAEETELEDWEETDDKLFAALTLIQGHHQTCTIRIRQSDIADITGANLCLIDDKSMEGGNKAGDRAQDFADFLMQDQLPKWGLFGIKKPFYVTRDRDEDLEKAVNAALDDNGETRKPVLLCGPSNSGKSMSLANLALRYAKKRKHPVIYIRGELLSGADNRLKDFISHWFCDADRFGGERPARTIVFWDGGGLARTEQDYTKLQSNLFNSNAQVVGTLYAASAPSARKVQLQQDFSAKELKKLREVISSLGGSYCERFDAILDSQRRAKHTQMKNSSLLYLLQTLFKFEFDNEYSDLRDLLQRQFSQEKDYAENYTRQGLEGYVKEFFKAQQTRAKLGVASSFQEKLQLILDRMAVEKQNEIQEKSEETRQLNMLKHLASCITRINSYLAVASEFGVQLPLSLLLRVLKSQDDVSYVPCGSEAGKIVDILRADTLVDFVYMSDSSFGEEYYVSFRNPIEAENYICLQCDLKLNDHSDKRKEYEKDKMLEIIALAENDVERWHTNELVRQFGPNGHGMLSELEKIRTRADYPEYTAYWMEIAQALIDRFPDDPESVILYAHLTREFIRRQPKEHQQYYEDTYIAARTRLVAALKEIDDGRLEASDTQYDRLNIELCANYQQSLQDKFNIVSYKDIKTRIHRAFLRDKKRGGSGRGLSSNSMLDILLNAYDAYRKAVHNGNLSGDDQRAELADILSDIADMLNFDQLVYEHANQAQLIGKIQNIYSELEDGAALLIQLEQQLESKQSDAFLFLQASLLWQRKANLPENSGNDPQKKLFAANRYAAISHDFPYVQSELSAEFWRQVRDDAGQVVAFFEREESHDKIKRSRSSRCVAMLIRAKWALKIGSPILAAKQCIPLTREEWDEIYYLCQQYITYHTSEERNRETFIPAYFLSGVYQWVYGDVREAKEFFKEAKERCDNQSRSVDRLILCAEGTDKPREFSVRIQKNETRYTAEILEERESGHAGKDRVLGRYGIGVTETVLRMLFEGTLPREQQQKAPNPAEIRFNLIGAQLGPAQSRGMSHER